ncbi:MAG: hypothetical protein DRI98_12705 [Bacteroidetes bacterium]|nr:MAG: hypothetical protein DRI98_12705 [Bacteroidota bacterium]
MIKKLLMIVALVASIVGIAAGLMSIYEKIFSGDELTIEQRLSPEMMKELKEGDGTITIEKGITIRRNDDTGS